MQVAKTNCTKNFQRDDVSHVAWEYLGILLKQEKVPKERDIWTTLMTLLPPRLMTIAPITLSDFIKTCKYVLNS